MQQNWQRRHQYVTLEECTLADMLRPAFPGRSVASAELLTSGLCNTNYKITMSGLDDAFVLRIYVRDREACQRDQHIFELVNKSVPIPELLYTDSASTFENVAAYAIMRWVDGELLSDILTGGDVDTIASCAYAAGTTLAHISSYTFPRAGFFAPDLSLAPSTGGNETYLSVIETFLYKGRAGQRLGKELTQRLWQLVEDNSAYFAQAATATSLVHADYKGFNILVRQQNTRWSVSAVLDWEFAFAGSPFFDIANMLRYEHLHPPAFATQFIRGYQDQGGHLPTGWRRTAKLLDLLSLCDFLNSPTLSNAMLEEVTGLVIRTIEQWETFGDA